jgi:hypothetical protein
VVTELTKPKRYGSECNDVPDDLDIICWKLQMKSSPRAVFEKLSKNDGRSSFWAESAVEQEGMIYFVFLD